MTRALGVLLLGVLLLPGASAEEPLTPEQRDQLEKQADDLNRQAIALYQAGKAAEAVVLARQALALRQRLYPLADYPDGHPELAQSLSNLGGLLRSMGEYGK